jgi:hypothetical protein
MSVMRGSFLGAPLPFSCAIVGEVVENCRGALGWRTFWMVDALEVVRVDGERRIVWRRGVRRRKRGDTCCCAIVRGAMASGRQW